jgi:hypothetical protein
MRPELKRLLTSLVLYISVLQAQNTCTEAAPLQEL